MYHDIPSRRAAFTWIELVLILVIVGIVVSLFLPAITVVRGDGSDFARSKNTLRQIAIVNLNRAAAFRDMLPSENTGGVFFDLLPDLEHDHLYRQFTISPEGVVDLASHLNVSRPRDTNVPSLISPGDYSSSGLVGICSFVPNPLIFPLYSAANTFQPPTNEQTGEPTHLLELPASFLDRISHTITFTERLAGCGGVPLKWFADGQRHMRAADDPDRLLVSSDDIRRQRVVNLPPAPYPGSGFNMTPPPMQFAVSTPTDPRSCDPNLPSTLYRQKILVALADGTVRVITPQQAAGNASPSVVPKKWPPHGPSMRVWGAACTPDGDEQFDQGW
jgi:hypothetical protein